MMSMNIQHIEHGMVHKHAVAKQDAGSRRVIMVCFGGLQWLW